MLGLSVVFMLVTFVIFVGYGAFAASVCNHVISCPHVMTTCADRALKATCGPDA